MRRRCGGDGDVASLSLLSLVNLSGAPQNAYFEAACVKGIGGVKTKIAPDSAIESG